MPRYQWHAFYAVASIAAAEGIHRVTHMPRWASAVTATVALGIVLLGEPANAARLVSVALIIAGIVGLKLATPA